MIIIDPKYSNWTTIEIVRILETILYRFTFLTALDTPVASGDYFFLTTEKDGCPAGVYKVTPLKGNEYCITTFQGGADKYSFVHHFSPENEKDSRVFKALHNGTDESKRFVEMATLPKLSATAGYLRNKITGIKNNLASIEKTGFYAPVDGILTETAETVEYTNNLYHCFAPKGTSTGRLDRALAAYNASTDAPIAGVLSWIGSVSDTTSNVPTNYTDYNDRFGVKLETNEGIRIDGVGAYKEVLVQCYASGTGKVMTLTDETGAVGTYTFSASGAHNVVFSGEYSGFLQITMNSSSVNVYDIQFKTVITQSGNENLPEMDGEIYAVGSRVIWSRSDRDYVYEVKQNANNELYWAEQDISEGYCVLANFGGRYMYRLVNGRFQSVEEQHEEQIVDLQSDLQTLENDVTTEIELRLAADTATNAAVSTINTKIPAVATASNQLADKAFVNSSIQNMAARYLTSNVVGDAFPTYAALSGGTCYYGGQNVARSDNDYTVVLADENHSGATTRYVFQGGQWNFQYVVNDTPFTQAQLNALNSGISEELLADMLADIGDKLGQEAADGLLQEAKDYTDDAIGNLDLGGDITQIQADYNQLNTSQVDYIKNIPQVLRNAATNEVGIMSDLLLSTTQPTTGYSLTLKKADTINSVLHYITTQLTLPNATTSVGGVMSAADKTKLNAITLVPRSYMPLSNDNGGTFTSDNLSDISSSQPKFFQTTGGDITFAPNTTGKTIYFQDGSSVSVTFRGEGFIKNADNSAVIKYPSIGFIYKSTNNLYMAYVSPAQKVKPDWNAPAGSYNEILNKPEINNLPDDLLV